MFTIKHGVQLPILKKQSTLKHAVTLSGKGVFTGKEVTLTCHPAPINTGIVFKRSDLPQKPLIPALLSTLQTAPRCTQVAYEDASVQTVEHLLAAIVACGIDNVLLEITGSEIPIMDGSATPFMEALESAGFCEQEEERQVYTLESPCYWSSGDIHLIALPAKEYRVSYTLHYPHSSFLRSQYYSVLINREHFKKEIAPCRTFSLYEEIAPLLEKGYLKGGSLENGVVIKGDTVLNPEGLRFPDEMVRHKVLDLVGDLSLMGFPFLAHIIAIRSGHSSNHAFAKELQNHFNPCTESLCCASLHEAAKL